MANFSPLIKLLLCYIALPVLRKLSELLERRAEKTENEWDDFGIAILSGIIATLEVLCYGEEK